MYVREYLYCLESHDTQQKNVASSKVTLPAPAQKCDVFMVAVLGRQLTHQSLTKLAARIYKELVVFTVMILF